MQSCPHCVARVSALPFLFSSPTRVFACKNCGKPYSFRQPFGLAMFVVLLCVAIDTYLHHYVPELGVWGVHLAVVVAVVLIYCSIVVMLGHTRPATNSALPTHNSEV
jgi:uncharacterized protein (DUF983 family)